MKFNFAHLMGRKAAGSTAAGDVAAVKAAELKAAMAAAAANPEPEEGDDEEDPEDDPDEEDPDDEDAKKAAAVSTVSAAADPSAEIARACTAAGIAHLAATFIDAGLSVDAVKARIADVPGIRAAVSAARKMNPVVGASLVDKFIAAGTSVNDAKANLLDMLYAAQSPEIINTLPAASAPAARQKQDYGWGKSIDKANAKLKGPTK